MQENCVRNALLTSSVLISTGSHARVNKERHFGPISCLRLHQVVYWEDDTKPETMGKVRVPWNQTVVTVSGLAANTQFFLTVSAFNTAGTGPFLPAINVTTKKPRKSPVLGFPSPL